MAERELKAEGTLLVRRYVQNNGAQFTTAKLDIGDGKNTLWFATVNGEPLHMIVRMNSGAIDFLSSHLSCSENHLRRLEPDIEEFSQKRPNQYAQAS